MTEKIDTRYLETLLGYNTRRASLTIISRFMERMVEFDLRPVDFSVLSLIGHNPDITARELCNALNILPPNMVGFLKYYNN
jgi:DNA-binding MarR family transcriptional regulator